MFLTELKQNPFIGILRGITIADASNIIEVSAKCGLKFIEVTLNTANALEIIKEMQRVSLGKIHIGAGTVLTYEEAEMAVKAGAEFIVSPTCEDGVMKYCTENNIPSFPGAFTPQEVYNAWKKGATMVKLFPAKFWGADYVKEIKGPFNDIEILACGGVTSTTAKEFLNKGASAGAFGGSVFNLSYMKDGKWDLIEKNLKELIDSVK